MKNRFVQVALGIMTSIGGYLDVGTIATSAEAGASFRYALIWSVVLGTVCLIFLIEMAGRLSIAFDTSAESWLNQQLQYDLWQAEKSRKRLHVTKLTAA